MGNDPAEYGPDTAVFAVTHDLHALSQLALDTADACAVALQFARHLCVESLTSGGKLLVCGNGGSAASAQHFAAELVGQFQCKRDGLAALCLNSDTALLTALANDFGYPEVFARQVQALGKTNDTLIALSTSGMSPNILRALEVAHTIGMHGILLTGQRMLEQHKYATCCVHVPSSNTQRIQEMHDALLHALATGIEEALYAA